MIKAVRFFENWGHKTITLMDNTLGSVSAYRPPTLEEERERLVPKIKEFRKEVDALIGRVTKSGPDREATGEEIIPYAFQTQEAVAQVRIHLTDAKMWAGKILEALGNPFPPELADKATSPDSAKSAM